MIRYKIKVQNPAGLVLGEFERFKNLKFNKRLNNYGSCSFSIPIDDAKAASMVAMRRFTVWIYREDDEDGSSDLIWAGEQAMRQGELGDDRNNWLTIHCYDWLEALNSRFTADEEIYTATDAGAIAWDLIDTTQSQTDGDFGIIQGTIEGTKVRDRQYHNDNIMENIINLANVIDGFDFEINNFKVFNVYNMIGVDRTDSVVFEYGRNISSMKITEDFIAPVNRAIVIGEDENNDTIRVIRNDVTLQGLNKVREKVLSELDVSDITNLQDKGDALIRKYGTTLFKIDMDIIPSTTPNVTEFALGDLITLQIKEGIYNIQDTYRIYEWSVEYTDKNTEKLSLVLGNFIS